MSLNVPTAVLERAERDEATETDLVACIQASLPYAWSLVSGLADQAARSGSGFADNEIPPPDEQARDQLLRMMASDAMRRAAERHFSVRIAFQNCHRAAVFTPQANEDRYEAFVSARAQLLNQSPRLRNC